jgi:hypothetical protein
MKCESRIVNAAVSDFQSQSKCPENASVRQRFVGLIVATNHGQKKSPQQLGLYVSAQAAVDGL